MVAFPLLIFVTVREMPIAASSGEIVVGDTVTMFVLLDDILTGVAKFEMCSSNVFVLVQVSVLVMVFPINTVGLPATTCWVAVIVNVSCAE